MSVAVGPILRAFYNGVVAGSATCDVYQAGATTTRVTIYSDATLTTPITNPATADSNGEFSFYVGNTYNLRCLLKTSDGTTIRDIDPLYPIANNIKGSDIASASAITLGDGNYFHITGTTTITSLSARPAGTEITLEFTGALVITHNASTLIMQGGINYTTSAGSVLKFVSEGSGNWREATRSTIAISGQGTTIASATTTDIASATGDFVDVSGTTTITALGTAPASSQREVRFTGALTLTYNATSLILPGAANITTANGDVATFRSLGSGNWVCAVYTKANGETIAHTLSSQDSRTNTSAVAQTLRVTTSGTPAAGIGTGQLFQAQSADETPSDFGQTEFVASDVTAGSEDTYFRILLRVAGAALSVAYEWIVTTAFKYTFTGAPSANRTITLPNFNMTFPASDGTSGQHVQTNGSGVLSFANPAFSLLAPTVTASSSATVDFTSLSTTNCAAWLVVFDSVVLATSGSDLWLRISTGAAFKSGASDYMCRSIVWGSDAGTASLSSAGTDHIVLDGIALNNGSNDMYNGTLYIYGPSRTTTHKNCSYVASATSSSGVFLSMTGSGSYIGALTALDGIRIMSSSGNIASGSITVFAIKNA